MQAVALGCLLVGILSVLFLPMPSHTFLWKAVNNFGHVPLFGLVAIVLLWISRMLSQSLGWSSRRQYGLALVGVLVLAFLTEALQLLDSARQTSLSDIVYDLVGGLCGLALFFIYDPHPPKSWVPWRQRPRIFILSVCVIGLLVIPLLPVLERGYAHWDRANRFPSLLEFSSEWEMKFVEARDSTLQVVVPPVAWNKAKDDLVGKVEFHLKKYPGFYLNDPYPDWRDYTSLKFDIYSELSHVQQFAIRIDDAEYNRTYTDGFNRKLKVLPGINHVHIAIEDIRQSPVSREMDLTSIRKVLFFTVSPPEEFTLYFDRIRLE